MAFAFLPLFPIAKGNSQISIYVQFVDIQNLIILFYCSFVLLSLLEHNPVVVEVDCSDSGCHLFGDILSPEEIVNCAVVLFYFSVLMVVNQNGPQIGVELHSWNIVEFIQH